jgi:hypothetical protein
MSGTRKGDVSLIREQTDVITGETVAPGGTLVTQLTYTPSVASNVKMLINGQMQIFGSGEDFTISGKTVTWRLSADFSIEPDDEIMFSYER